MIEDLTPAEVAERLAADPPALLVDVREGWERDRATIAGSMHIPLGDLPARIGALPEDASIILYCHHGMRSAQAGVWLAQQGYDDVAHLEGGIDAWSRDLDDSIPRYG